VSEAREYSWGAEVAMEPAKAVKEYKNEIDSKDIEIEELQKQLGKSIIEK